MLEHIFNKDLVSLRASIDEALEDIIAKRLVEMKKDVQAKHFVMPIDEELELVFEGGRFKIVKARIRHGKIQRRKKVATQDGFTMRGGKIHKMNPRERMNRKLSQKKARFKRRSKKHQARRATIRAMRKRRSIGLK